jgi:hypothetical protein
VRVLQRPATDVEDTDQIADSIGSAIGAVLKANPKLAGGLSWLGIASGQGDYQVLDDETISIHAYQVQFRSRITWG